MENLNGFMIMPFLSKKERKELTHKGESGCSETIKKKKLSEDFYNKIIKKASQESKIEIKRADEIFKSQEVVSKIIKGIEESDIVIVDLTLFRPNVLYELGIAHHIDPNRTLLITQEDFNDIPFDIKGFTTLVYNSTDVDFVTELNEKLKGLCDYHYEKEICLGISPYPELMILIKKLKEAKFPITIRNIAWDETFLHFHDGEKIDFVIANADLCQKLNSKHTDFIYRGDLIKYNSFYVISKNQNAKGFSDLINEYPDTKKCIQKTMNQFNYPERKTIIYASNKTDHVDSFYKFNSIFGSELIKNFEIRDNGSPKEILSDFIQSNGDLFIGGIPERINLLKNKNYKLIIDCNDVKHEGDFKNIINDLKQRNGIVYHRKKEREIDHLEDIIKMLYKYWNEAYSEIIELHKVNDMKTLSQYLASYNNLNYVKTFNVDNIELKVNSRDFIENYINGNLITVE